jgi:hypothetical protein
MLHDKADGIAAAAAAKAFIYFFGGRYGERRRFFAMKRAKAQVIGAPFFQFYKTAYNFNNIYAAEYLLYGLLTDHS